MYICWAHILPHVYILHLLIDTHQRTTWKLNLFKNSPHFVQKSHLPPNFGLFFQNCPLFFYQVAYTYEALKGGIVWSQPCPSDTRATSTAGGATNSQDWLWASSWKKKKKLEPFESRRLVVWRRFLEESGCRLVAISTIENKGLCQYFGMEG